MWSFYCLLLIFPPSMSHFHHVGIFYPEVEPTSLVSPALAGGLFTTEPSGKPSDSRLCSKMGLDYTFKEGNSNHVIHMIIDVIGNSTIISNVISSPWHLNISSKTSPSNYLLTWCEELTHWKGPQCWDRWKAGGERDDRGWDSWMASPTPWIWFEQAPGVGNGQGSLACCSPWGHKELDTTEWLNWWSRRIQYHRQAAFCLILCNDRNFLSSMPLYFFYLNIIFPLLPFEILFILKILKYSFQD